RTHRDRACAGHRDSATMARALSALYGAGDRAGGARGVADDDPTRRAGGGLRRDLRGRETSRGPTRLGEALCGDRSAVGRGVTAMRRTLPIALSVAALGVAALTVAAQSVAPKADQNLIAHGRYLVQIAACNDCHTPGYMQTAGKVDEKL